MEELSEGDLRKEILKLWVEIGRDPTKIKLDNKTIEQLQDALEKLRAIKFSFKILFSEGGNYALAISVLSKVFSKDE